MTSTITHALAAEHRADLLAQAEHHRLVRSARGRAGVRVTWFARFAPAVRRPRLATG